MKYMVQPGDSLWSIAESQLGDPNRWIEIAQLNEIESPYILLIGQELRLPDKPIRPIVGGGIGPPRSTEAITGRNGMVPNQNGANTMPGRAFLFILADEILPSGKVVRKVLQVPAVNIEQYMATHPEIFGITPKNPSSTVSLGEHALGNTNSRFISASTKRGGSPNISGRPVYIDIAKAERAGVTIHSTQEIIADLDRLAKENAQLRKQVNKLKGVIEKVEGEVLLEGKVPAAAVKSARALALTRGLQFVQAVGVILTVYDLGEATHKSVVRHSLKPIAAESIRQVGGWGMALAGMKIGGGLGAAVGIETGPGAILTGAVGALIFGTAGYFGFGWVADHIDKK